MNNNKRPFISIKDLSIPENRINQNGLLDHPAELVDAYKEKHKRKHRNHDQSLLEIFKQSAPFKISNSSLPAPLIEKIISKQAAAWASQQLRFYSENAQNFNQGNYNNGYYNKPQNCNPVSGIPSSFNPVPNNSQPIFANSSFAKASSNRFSSHSQAIPQFSSGYRQMSKMAQFGGNSGLQGKILDPSC